MRKRQGISIIARFEKSGPGEFDLAAEDIRNSPIVKRDLFARHVHIH